MSLHVIMKVRNYVITILMAPFGRLRGGCRSRSWDCCVDSLDLLVSPISPKPSQPQKCFTKYCTKRFCFGGFPIKTSFSMCLLRIKLKYCRYLTLKRTLQSSFFVWNVFFVKWENVNKEVPTKWPKQGWRRDNRNRIERSNMVIAK
jgi:hypothetical protein